MDIIGIDIGGTKCAVIKADQTGRILQKIKFATMDVESTLAKIFSTIEEIGTGSSPTFGISCGGPLDSNRGIILSPPNLPKWDNIAIVSAIEARFGGKAFLMNDANAGALAEWKFGVGQPYQNIIFLTFGTGMGAGLILNGQLYEGSCGTAGEVGHIRLADTGPIGYGKKGSFEGFCSGGGLAQMASDIPDIVTAKDLAIAAENGNEGAREIFVRCGTYLGRALSILIDIFNPETIILGSIFGRCQGLLEASMYKELERETLPSALAACKIQATGLGEQIGDYAAIAVAVYHRSNH